MIATVAIGTRSISLPRGPQPPERRACSILTRPTNRRGPDLGFRLQRLGVRLDTPGPRGLLAGHLDNLGVCHESPRAFSALSAALTLVPTAVAVSARGTADSAGSRSGRSCRDRPGGAGRRVDVTIDGEAVESDVAAGEVLGPYRWHPASTRSTSRARGLARPRRWWSWPAATRTSSCTCPLTRAARPGDVVPGADRAHRARQGPGAGVAHRDRRPADVRVDGKVVFADIANGEFATADVPAGKHVVALLPPASRPARPRAADRRPGPAHRHHGLRRRRPGGRHHEPGRALRPARRRRQPRPRSSAPGRRGWRRHRVVPFGGAPS